MSLTKGNQPLTVADKAILQDQIGILPDTGSASLPKFRAGCAAMQLGQRDVVIQVVGDSTVSGCVSTGTTTTYVGAFQKSFPTRLAALLNASGIPAIAQSWFGSGALFPTHTVDQYNPYVTSIGAGWAVQTGVQPGPPGGPPLTNSTTTNPVVVTPTVNVDTVDIWYIQDTSNGIFSYAVDGRAATNVNSGAARSLQKVTVPLGSPGIHTITLARVSGGQVQLVGAEFYNSAKRQVRIRNLGTGSSTTANWASTAQTFNPGSVLGVKLAADLTIIDLGINDSVQGVAPASIQANLVSVGTAALRGGGDLLFIKPFPSALGSVSASDKLALDAAVQAAADALGYPCLSWTDRVISNAAAQAAGLAGISDGLHPSDLGYQDFNNLLFAYLRGHGL